MKSLLSELKFMSFLTPGGVSSGTGLLIAILAMVALFAVDGLDSDAIRLQTLYVFPLAFIVMHSTGLRPVLFGYALSVVLQVFTFVSYDILTVSKIAGVLVAISASGLTMALAILARDRYLATLDLAAQDPLTGLLNQRSFGPIVETEMARQRRYGGAFSIAAIDLDNFKQLNDTQGHRAGDDALIKVANVLRMHTRETDAVGRLGGDEFAVLMPATAEADCAHVCAILCAQIAKSMMETNYPVTASIGHSTFVAVQESTAQVMMIADAAMYEAKAMGKGCVVAYPRPLKIA